MGDAAKRWISPYWRGDNPDFARLVVLNPNAEPADVRVHWYDGDGSVVGEQAASIAANSFILFVPGDQGSGWLRISSDRPVAPYGETPFSAHRGYTTMAFYREDLPPHPKSDEASGQNPDPSI
jgi:hypothetical protein